VTDPPELYAYFFRNGRILPRPGMDSRQTLVVKVEAEEAIK